jgi:16S rRNA (cytidine1402-2'-O)-methyltransferase
MHAFHFMGFLHRKAGPRRRQLEQVAAETNPLVIFESPHRLLAGLQAIRDVLGDRPAVVARELTKVHEEFVRGRLSELRAHFEQHAPRGEFTLVVAGADEGAEREAGDAERPGSAEKRRRCDVRTGRRPRPARRQPRGGPIGGQAETGQAGALL